MESHLFARQYGVMIKDNCGYLYVNIIEPEEINYLATILKCDFRFTHNGFYNNGKRYSTLRIIREESPNENKDCGD